MSDVTPTDAQAAVIKDIVNWYKGGRNTPQVYYLAGFAGTGKSTIAKFVVDALSSSATFKVTPAAFTGKAANVLRQKGNPNACTFHSGMYIPKETPSGRIEFILDQNAPFAMTDLIMGDECSMINEVMAKDTESFGKKILIMGDPGQLPPVEGYGYWIKRKPNAFLHEVHRQALDSPILRLATIARRGRELPVGSWSDSEGNKTQVFASSADRDEYMTSSDSQAICGTHKHRMYFTAKRRAKEGYDSALPLAGERLLCCKNDKSIGIYNGCFGTLFRDVTNTKYSNILMDVKMDDLVNPLTNLKVNPYLFKQHFSKVDRPPFRRGIQEFDWGYVLTCHKAQGSEWDSVTVLDDSAVFREDRDRWRYTAITRASKSINFLLTH